MSTFIAKRPRYSNEIEELIVYADSVTGKRLWLSIDSCIGFKYNTLNTLEAFSDWYVERKAQEFCISENDIPTLRELIRLRWEVNSLTHKNILKEEKNLSETKSEVSRGIVDKHIDVLVNAFGKEALIEGLIRRRILKDPNVK